MKLILSLSSFNIILRRIVHTLSRTINAVGTVVLLGMMFITTGDVLLRYVSNHPIPGAFELVELMLAIVVFFGLAYTATQRGHIVVEVLFVLLPKGAQAIVAVITSLLSLGIFIITVYGIVQLIHVHLDTNAVSSVLEIPLYPITIAIAFGVVLLCLVLLIEMIDCLTKEQGK